jgi:hypothetical protein
MVLVERDDPADCRLFIRLANGIEINFVGERARNTIDMIRAAADANEGGPIPLMPIQL